MTYNLWVGKTLYMSTRDAVRAFTMFKKFQNRGHNASLRFVQDVKVAA